MPIDIVSLLKPDERAEFDALSPERQAAFRADFDETINDTLKPVAIVLGVAERVMDLAYTSDLLPKIAKLQRRYFEALLTEGFSSSEAMALASNFASFLSAVKKG
ncbi:hypothetical protein EKK58_00475 [Candidatus Dependentiae bacterium]|nr:MAG: hypothetical protein EKK58_00475 [Candidatus Dependentiae bacterium]